MTNEEAKAYFIDNNERIISAAKDDNIYNYETQQVEDVFMRRTFEANELAINALEQKPVFFPPCQDCNTKMDEIRRAYDKLKNQEYPHKTEYKKMKTGRKLIKLDKVFSSFILALYIVAMPFVCALSYALNWSIEIKFIFTLATLISLIGVTVFMYTDIKGDEI